MSYRDRYIDCAPDALVIRGYYFPWGGSKRIAYDSIRSIRRVPLNWLTGKGRIWGTGNPRMWANLDPARPRKAVGLVLEVGRSVRPLITPDDPDAVEAEIRARAGLGPASP